MPGVPDSYCGLARTGSLVRRFCFILNPSAGARQRGSSDPLAARLAELCPAAELLVSSAPGHAPQLARERSGQPDQVVVAVGGDGTVHEVAGGLAGGEALMAVLPLGSGNDFARMLASPRQLDAALAWWQTAQPRPVDLGRVRIKADDGRVLSGHFINSLGLGFEAEAAARAARARFWRGFARYLVAVLGLLPGYRAPRLKLHYEAAPIEARQFLLAIGNGRWAGGGFQLAPNARIDDGWLELTRADDLSLPRLLRILPHVFSGGHLRFAGVHAARIQSIEIDCIDPVMVHADGEIIATAARRIEVSVEPGALRLLG